MHLCCYLLNLLYKAYVTIENQGYCQYLSEALFCLPGSTSMILYLRVFESIGERAEYLFKEAFVSGDSSYCFEMLKIKKRQAK